MFMQNLGGQTKSIMVFSEVTHIPTRDVGRTPEKDHPTSTNGFITPESNRKMRSINNNCKQQQFSSSLPHRHHHHHESRPW